ncbi:hypothetical protein D3C80_1214440 [compost metagenome]
MLGRVTVADQHLPGAAADAQLTALVQAAKAGARQGMKMLILHGGKKLAGLLGAEPSLAVEVDKSPGWRLIQGHLDVQPLELRGSHVQRALEALGKPGRDTGVVAMKVGADHRLHRLSLEHLAEYLLPHLEGLRGVHAGVDHHPTVLVLKQVEVDVVEAKRQRHAQPEHPAGHFAHLAIGRWLWPGVAQAVAQFSAAGVQVSHDGHLQTAQGLHVAAPRPNTADRYAPARRG